MPKSRKKPVNTIIFELDNDDLSSSDVESVDNERPVTSDKRNTSIINLDSENDEVLSEKDSGGQTVKSDRDDEEIDCSDSGDDAGIIDIRDEIPNKYLQINGSNENQAPDLEEDTDSSSNNRHEPSPLLTVQFHNNAVASRYRQAIKQILQNLIKLDELDDLQQISNLNNDKLEIWPIDCADTGQESVPDNDDEVDDLFVFDTDPANEKDISVPSYSQKFDVLIDTKDKVEVVEKPHSGPICFNCDGAHVMRECTEPRNQNKINERMRSKPIRVGRYHTEDDQRYGHFVPGRISGVLRAALGLKRNQLPIHIYRMRLLGYPPGWLEEARISHSGIAMFDSIGNVIQDPEDEDGEICEAGSKDKYDIKKILDFPGYNVKASSRYKEESSYYRLPPLSENDSKLLMLERLAPNSMKAYKRKKLQLIASGASPIRTQGEVADMDLDENDDETEMDFPIVPPLPDDEPAAPTPPPPPPSPPPEEPKVADIPTPKLKPKSHKKRTLSPSLEDLEQRKKRLLEALSSDVSLPSPPQECLEVPDTTSPETSSPKEDEEEDSSQKNDEKSTVSSLTDSNDPATPRSGHVKTSDLGTPLMNIASSFLKLPENENFAKDICDVLNFENLPDSTGKYKKMSSLIKKVRNVVARIQDENDEIE